MMNDNLIVPIYFDIFMHRTIHVLCFNKMILKSQLHFKSMQERLVDKFKIGSGIKVFV